MFSSCVARGDRSRLGLIVLGNETQGAHFVLKSVANNGLFPFLTPLTPKSFYQL